VIAEALGLEIGAAIAKAILIFWLKDTKIAADVDQMSNNPSITRDRRDVRRLESQPQPAMSRSDATLGL